MESIRENFASLEYISDNKVLFCYPQYYCTLGYAERIFKQVILKDVKATLVKSIKTGADSCVIEVQW